ncbi:tripartite tricarboxylate transporter TctB family protein [Rhodoplanes sp. TEM]|uniref:Tripartite tricarboxylate transporter TctB family protein n=1 Tax=Rhodoplanes tepidamans TaxID=200616 RepID=A0ABT5J5W6_RHOTP|nr:MULTISPECIES: tripartite tricarboxylate transporter TctB family protein [Rhodoplanes]MDC7784430.1 tripartite tricarboxylate transporter TctB family protein [Rhodoplanes tepidamans]MDC7983460.1 tripartite tricarboxylate transporter TctB family protein [Rhodoplanes sp. TEM]MDQ0356937.1 F0F1-type ATP synthase assembly protein I [Rhodoplanes tepidamans]
MLWVNRIVGVALILVCAALWQISADYPEMARLFPRVIFAIIVFFSALMVGRTFLPAAAAGGSGEGGTSASVMVRPVLAFVATSLALAVSTYVGFFLAMVVLAAALVPILGVRQRGWYAFATVVLLVVVYVVFVIVLNVPLTLRPPVL